MNGAIAQLLLKREYQQQVKLIFQPQFQSYPGWVAYLMQMLPQGSVYDQIRAPANKWTRQSFHALYIACWIHHPMEKGTFMIDISCLRDHQYEAWKKQVFYPLLNWRKSSHLSGTGRSAAEGWAFLNGYSELLVQKEKTNGKRYLLLKAEGHTTGIGGIVPHLRSWWHKREHGEGLMASPALHSAASLTSGIGEQIDLRAAENYGKGYKKLLKDELNLKGKMITVREMIPVLFKKYNHPLDVRDLSVFSQNATNQDIGVALQKFCNTTGPTAGVDAAAIKDLRELAATLIHDGARKVDRVYCEVRVTPEEVDDSLHAFFGAQR